MQMSMVCKAVCKSCQSANVRCGSLTYRRRRLRQARSPHECRDLAWILERETEESNLEQGFWRPSCYRYTSLPGARRSTIR